MPEKSVPKALTIRNSQDGSVVSILPSNLVPGEDSRQQAAARTADAF